MWSTKWNHFLCFFLIVFSSAAITSPSQPTQHLAHPTAPHSFVVNGSRFLMDGKPYQIISGEMHYPRVPRAYWRDRFRKARAMGLNTITTYAFWNLHEPAPGKFDFSGQNDIAEYIREAQQEGLNVILRPGPYVCAEWELGGYPSWLLKDRSLVLRSSEPKYTAAVQAWFARLGKEIQPLLLKNGGPIIAVQVENEYGSFGDDRKYLEIVKQQIIDAGMGDTVLYTANPPEAIATGSLPGLATVVNFGTGHAKTSFATLEELRPEGPRMSGEYWAGWFDSWGAPHHRTDSNQEASELRWMLQQGYSVSLYMFEGGTNFGWTSGANSDGHNYAPDTTSYDYDAPLDERGEPRTKFDQFRKVIAETTGLKPAILPKLDHARAFPISQPTLTASLWRNLPTPVTSKTPLTFEDLNQPYGYVLYRTGLDAGDGGKLVIDGLHDYAQIYVDQQLLGTLDRRAGTNSLDLPTQTHASTLDILVENTGRVNFTKVIRSERQGITGNVMVGAKQPANWEIYSLPMNSLSSLRFEPEPCRGPCFYQAEMTVKQPADTYIETTHLHKGFVWVDSHPIGRFWSIGPQFALYTPGPWLGSGKNTVIIFDLQGEEAEQVKTARQQIFSTLRSQDPNATSETTPKPVPDL